MFVYDLQVFGRPNFAVMIFPGPLKVDAQEVSNHDMSVSSALRSVLRSVAKPKRKAVAAIFGPAKK